MPRLTPILSTLTLTMVSSLPSGQTIILPAGAPAIVSDFHDQIGVNGSLRRTKHQGIDILGPVGMPVLSAAPGIVLETDIGQCWGPTIVIDHGYDPDQKPLIAAYGHLGVVLTEKGDVVTRGQVIARLGDNAADFRCIQGIRHLHFQIGRKHRKGLKGTYWGHMRYLKDGRKGVNPHALWADGPGRVTCYRADKRFPDGTLTFPAPCE